MASNAITNNHFHKIICGIEHKKSRISIDVKNNIIGDGIEFLGPLLMKSSYLLESLNVKGNSLANIALTSFAIKLKDCKAPIQSINLSNNNIPLSTGSLLLQSTLNNSNCNIKLNLERNPECVS